jgi:hypothetical protein
MTPLQENRQIKTTFICVLLEFIDPPSPLPCVKVHYIHNIDSVWLGGEGVGVLSPVRDHILQEFSTLYLTYRTYKIARQPQTKT